MDTVHLSSLSLKHIYYMQTHYMQQLISSYQFCKWLDYGSPVLLTTVKSIKIVL